MKKTIQWQVALAGAALLLIAPEAGAALSRVEGIYYEVRGTGYPLVLLHGGQMDRRIWDPQFTPFAAHYRVIRYDLRGYGKTGQPKEPYSHFEDLSAVLKRLKVAKAHLVGLSLGAAVATDFAIAYPDQVSALVLACPGLGGFQFTDEGDRMRKIMEAARDESLDRATELWLQHPFMVPAMENPVLSSRLRSLSRDNAHCWLVNPVLSRQMRPPAIERLAEVRAPTLIIGGDRDTADITQIITKLSGEIPSSRKVIVEGAGHIVNMEKPGEFNKLVLDFLDGVAKKTAITRP